MTISSVHRLPICNLSSRVWVSFTQRAPQCAYASSRRCFLHSPESRTAASPEGSGPTVSGTNSNLVSIFIPREFSKPLVQQDFGSLQEFSALRRLGRPSGIFRSTVEFSQRHNPHALEFL